MSRDNRDYLSPPVPGHYNVHRRQIWEKKVDKYRIFRLRRRENLRIFFEVNRYYIVVAALKALTDEGEIDHKLVQQAIKKYKIDSEKPNLMTV